jgi:Homing endonuclease associated repeat
VVIRKPPPSRVDITDLIKQTTAARLRGVSAPAIHSLVRRGRLRAVEIDGTTYVLRSEVLAFRPSRRQQVRLMSNEEILNDVRRVARLLGHWPDTAEQKAHGEINLTVLWRRFGSWAQVLSAAQRK